MTTGKQNLKTWVYGQQTNKQSTNNEFSPRNILGIGSVKIFNVTTKSSIFESKVCNAE